MIHIKLLIYGGVLAAVVAVLATCYVRGRSDATEAADLKIARQTIKLERDTLKITHEVTMRVDTEGVQTAHTAKAATDEIQAIRTQNPTRPATDSVGVANPVRPDADGDARIVQLAREARAAAITSSARLQPARASDR